ncbi:MAG TPA: hypothetical protein VMU47_11070 [Caldimonas sp.]|nr:hypothetical protein [Caldimonas sp.]
MSQLTRRRILLVSLVAITALLAFGCATPGVQCGMKDNYEHETPIAREGHVLLSWKFGVTPACGNEHTYGCTQCENGVCSITLREEPPSFNDVCGLAKWAHEALKHGMGATHEQPR